MFVIIVSLNVLTILGIIFAQNKLDFAFLALAILITCCLIGYIPKDNKEDEKGCLLFIPWFIVANFCRTLVPEQYIVVYISSVYFIVPCYLCLIFVLVFIERKLNQLGRPKGRDEYVKCCVSTHERVVWFLQVILIIYLSIMGVKYRNWFYIGVLGVSLVIMSITHTIRILRIHKYVE